MSKGNDNGNDFTFEYPSRVKDKKGKVNYLKRKIKKLKKELEDIDINATEKAIKLGIYLIELKRLLKEEKQDFTPVINECRGLHIKSAQRYMKLALNIGPNPPPELIGSLGKTRLYSLCRYLGKGETIPELLLKNGLEYQGVDYKDEDIADQLKFDVDELLMKLSGEKSGSESTTVAKTRGVSWDELEVDGDEPIGEEGQSTESGEEDANQNGESDTDSESTDGEVVQEEDSGKGEPEENKPKNSPHKFEDRFTKAVNSLSKCIELALEEKPEMQRDRIGDLTELTIELEKKLAELRQFIRDISERPQSEEDSTGTEG